MSTSTDRSSSGRRGGLRIVSLIVIGITLLPACAKNMGAQGGDALAKTDRDVASVVSMVAECPPWTEIQAHDAAAQGKLLAVLEQVANLETAVIREAIECHIQALVAKASYSVDEMSKLFVLNRYLFNIPRRSKLQDARYFGGWLGVPENDASVDLSWPISIGAAGKPVLVGIYSGYLGDDYKALQEFDYFNKRFGRR